MGRDERKGLFALLQAAVLYACGSRAGVAEKDALPANAYVNVTCPPSLAINFTRRLSHPLVLPPSSPDLPH